MTFVKYERKLIRTHQYINEEIILFTSQCVICKRRNARSGQGQPITIHEAKRNLIEHADFRVRKPRSAIG